MEEHLKNIFRWLEERYGKDEDIVMQLWGDLSGSFRFERNDTEDLFLFDNIMDIKKEDIDKWDKESEKNWINEFLK